MQLEFLGPDVAFAAEAIRDAVRFVRATEQAAIEHTLTKANASPATAADFVVQAFVASRLMQRFPNDSLVAEEDARALRVDTTSQVREHVTRLVSQILPDTEIDSEQVLRWIDRGGGACGRRFWTLDPIDGTKGLLRGGQYVIALALVVDGRVEIGIVGCPRVSVTTGPASAAYVSEHAAVTAIEGDVDGGVAIAVRRRGAWWMSLQGNRLQRLSASAESDPRRTRALHSRESSHSDRGELQRVLSDLRSHAPPVLMDGQAKQVLLAAGAAELLMRIPIDREYRETIWDQAAGALLVEEAGGRVTDVDGLPLDFTTGRHLLRNTGLLASNGLLHDAVLDIVRQRSVR